MTYFLQLSFEDDFLSLFARIWIEIHFPLESPIKDPAKSIFSLFVEVFMSCVTENKDVPSGKKTCC